VFVGVKFEEETKFHNLATMLHIDVVNVMERRKEEKKGEREGGKEEERREGKAKRGKKRKERRGESL
jgi:hypothetical protein